MTLLKINTTNLTKLKTRNVNMTSLESSATNTLLKNRATIMTPLHSNSIALTSSQFKGDRCPSLRKSPDINKYSDTEERRNLSTYFHFKTWSLKLKFKFPGLANISWLVLVVYCLLMVHTSNGTANFRQREKKILDEIIGPAGTYDKRIRPAGANDTGPSVVYINIMIRDVQTISDVKMEYAIQMTFREQWTDSRLIFDNMGGRIQYLTLTETDMVWMPDLFFRNEKEGHFHNIILPNLYIRIYPDGGVLYSIRISLTLSCPMNLKLFPLDRQQCQLVMASYGWTTEDLVFLWKDIDPVQVTKNLHLPRFTLEKFITDYCNSKTNTGEYSCLRVDLIFKREFSYYLIQYYIPCCMLVIVSWVSFWLDQNAVPARVALGVTTLLTMSTQTSSINQSLPPVSYTKAIDVWTGVCLTFVFGALLEFALVNYASRSDKQREKMKEKVKEQKKQWEMEIEAAALAEQVEEGTSAFAMKPLVSRRNGGMGSIGIEKGRPCEIHLQPQRKNFCRTWLSKFPTRSKRIDVISRITFPLVFAFFNMAYWSTYLFTDEDEDVKP